VIDEQGPEDFGAFEDFEEPPPSRPTIRLDAYQRPSDIADAVLAALAARNILHRRGGVVVAVRGWTQEEAPKRTATGQDGKERPQVAIREGSPVVRMVRGGALDYTIDRELAFARAVKGEDKIVSCPPRVQSMIGGIGGDQVLPPLESIIQVPSLRPDGTVIDVPGYDAATGYYLASKVRLSHLHATPTKDNAIRAREYLKTIFGPNDTTKLGFPWRRPDEWIVPLALAMTALVRPAVGNVPATAIDASTPGSGKGKIVGLCSIIATGEEPARSGWPSNPEEQDKTLGGYAVAAPPIIAFDNVRGGISNQCLENALTTPIYGFRVLGVHEIMMLPFRSIVTFTGNNLGFLGDMIRRIIIGRLEPQTEHPEKLEPDAFRIPFIEQYVRENRAKIVSAILTIVRAYFLAGMPDQGLRMGSFDRASGGLGWIELVGGSIAWCEAGDITQFSGKENVEEPEEWSHVRTLLANWPQLDTNGGGLPLSSLLSLLYTSDVVEHIRKGTRGSEGEQDWRAERVDCRAALQALARCPDRAIPDSTKLGNGLRPYVGRWLAAGGKERRFAHALSPATGKPFVPARWKVEER
jgi:hypothetical protein